MLGGTTTGANESLEAQVEYKAKRGWKKTKALIDSGADMNLILQLLVKESGWQLRTEGAPNAHSISGQRLQVYGVVTITMSIIDQDGKAKTKQNDFVATDLPDYEVILGKPWL